MKAECFFPRVLAASSDFPANYLKPEALPMCRHGLIYLHGHNFLFRLLKIIAYATYFEFCLQEQNLCLFIFNAVLFGS